MQRGAGQAEPQPRFLDSRQAAPTLQPRLAGCSRDSRPHLGSAGLGVGPKHWRRRMELSHILSSPHPGWGPHCKETRFRCTTSLVCPASLSMKPWPISGRRVSFLL